MNNLEEQKETIDVSADDVVTPNTINKKIKKAFIKYRFERLISECSFLILVLLYVIFSLTIKGPFGPYNLNGWAFWWILFLLLPAIYKTLVSVRHHHLMLVPIFDIVLVSYLLVGLLTGLWHPYWALFFIVPGYHILITRL